MYSIPLLCDSICFDSFRAHGGYSSVGRASDCGSEGRAFKPR